MKYCMTEAEIFLELCNPSDAPFKSELNDAALAMFQVSDSNTSPKIPAFMVLVR